MKKKVILIIIVALVAFIWGQSFMPQTVSRQESGFVYQIVKPFLELFVGEGNLTGNMVRKIAHFTEFAALGIVLGLIFRKKRFGFLWAALIAFLVAFLDETIQIFSGRGPMIKDVWLDLSGAVCGAGIICLISFLRRRQAGDASRQEIKQQKTDDSRQQAAAENGRQQATGSSRKRIETGNRQQREMSGSWYLRKTNQRRQ